MKKPKILLYDIETTPNVGYTWGKYQQDVLGFQKEWELLSFAYKFVGEKTVVVKSRRTLSEGALVKSLHAVLGKADMVVTHNGVSFDNKKANTKFIQYGLKPTAPAPQFDTCRVAKSAFAFTSNRLGDLGKFLNLGEKISTGGFDLWVRCMAGEKKALLDMERYNKQDVVLLEKVYDALKIYSKTHPRLSLLQGVKGCPACESTHVQKRGFKVAGQSIRQQWACLDCGHWYQTSKTGK